MGERRRRDSAFAVIVRRSRVLLVRAADDGRWQLPGGGVKRRETPREAARREVEEETGLVPELLHVTGRYLRGDGSTVLVFAARVSGTAPLAGPRNEIREQRWVHRGKALRLLRRKARQRLAEALAVPRPVGGARHRRSLRMSG